MVAVPELGRVNKQRTYVGPLFTRTVNQVKHILLIKKKRNNYLKFLKVRQIVNSNLLKKFVIRGYERRNVKMELTKKTTNTLKPTQMCIQSSKPGMTICFKVELWTRLARVIAYPHNHLIQTFVSPD